MLHEQHSATATASSGADPTGIAITMLGGFSVVLGRCEVPPAAFARRKAIDLLKLVVLQPDLRLHRDQAVDALWPDLSPRAAAAQLYKAIYHIRQAFAAARPAESPDDLLQLRDEVISLSAPGGVQTDAATFERLAREALREREPSLLERASACYAGDLLPADRYDDWVGQRRAALGELYLDVLAALGEGYLVVGRLDEAAEVLRRALARDPTREELHCALMRLYALQGSRTRALRQYRLCVETLAGELGVEPSPETAQLHRQILDQEVRPQRSSHAAAAELPALRPLVGRRPELQTIAALLQGLARGRGAVLALEGEAGIGKTRLVLEILHLGRQRRWQVLLGGTHEEEGQSSYLPFVEALRMALRADPAQAELIPAELAAAIPELPPTAVPVATADRLAAQSALFAGVLRFLSVRARTAPLILALDDLHAADEGSLRLLHYIARQVAQVPLLVVGTWRTHHPGTPPLLASIAGSLERQGELHRLTLSPLSSAEHHALLEQVLEGGGAAPDLTGEIYRFSGGNPLFARELARHWAAGGATGPGDSRQPALSTGWGDTGAASPIPQSVRSLLGGRLAALSTPGLRLIQLAAVLGQDLPLRVLEASLGGESGAIDGVLLLDLLDEVLAAGLLEELGLGYRFPHPLLRETVYQGLSEARRRSLHGRVAIGWEGMYREEPAALPADTVAYHARQAGDTARAVRYLVEAGDRARAVFDHALALRRYEEALAQLAGSRAPDLAGWRAAISERIGDIHRSVGDVRRSLVAYEQALDSLDAPATDADRQRFALHRKVALGAILTVDMPTAADHLARAGALLGGDPPEEARWLIARALFDWHTNMLDDAVARAAQALELAERAGGPIEISQACEILALSHLPQGHWEEGLRYELRRQTPDWSPEIVVAVDAHLCLFKYRLNGAESYRQVQSFIETVARQATGVGNLRCVAVCYFVLGTLAFYQGQPEVAAANLARALDLHERIGSPAGAAYTIARQIELATALGALDAGWSLVQPGLDQAGQAAIRDHCLMCVQAAGLGNRVAAGDLAVAADLARVAKRHDAEAGQCFVCRVDLYAELAAFHVAAGELVEAAEYAGQALGLARAMHNRPGQARALRVLGQVQAARGEIVEAEESLSESAAACRDLDDRYGLARTLQEWGGLPVTGAPAAADERRRLREEAATLLRAYSGAAAAAAGG